MITTLGWPRLTFPIRHSVPRWLPYHELFGFFFLLFSKLFFFQENLIEQNLRLFSLISQKYYSWLSRKLPSNREDPAPLDHIEALFEETAVANGQFIILKLLCLVSPSRNLLSFPYRTFQWLASPHKINGPSFLYIIAVCHFCLEL